MKTSNKLVLISLLLILVALVIYDLLLKEEYLKGNYKIPFSNYIRLPWKNFDAVEVNASTVANVKFVQGPFGVRIDDDALEYVKISQINNRLKIDVNFEDYYHGNPNEYILVISCPKLLELSTNATYRSDNIRITDSTAREDWNVRQVMVEGFKQDTLTINQDYGSSIALAGNAIQIFRAVVGKSQGSGSKMIIKENNQLQVADIDIRYKSKLQLEDAVIRDFSYQLADNAKLTISGNAKDLLNNLKPYRK